tara:strand:+ start:220 stop:471 length:252 start_codon:yes stop_codon:yes gene_type:complete
MSITLIATRNPQWKTITDDDGNAVNDSEGNPIKVINCECQWSHLGDNTQDWLPFTASATDTAQHGKDLYNAFVNGDHGTIANE